MSWGELDANGGIQLDLRAGLFQPAGGAVNLEEHDVVGQLICGEQVGTGGIDLKIPWHDSAAVNLFNRG